MENAGSQVKACMGLDGEIRAVVESQEKEVLSTLLRWITGCTWSAQVMQKVLVI